MGVYATRSPHRPNRLGLSVVEFDSLTVLDNEIVLQVRGVDLVDGTPILDIKPYVPYTDSIINARSPFSEAPVFLPVKWLCEPIEKELIEKVVGLDPRPAQDKEINQEFGISVAGLNVRFRFLITHFEIVSAIRLKFQKSHNLLQLQLLAGWSKIPEHWPDRERDYNGWGISEGNGSPPAEAGYKTETRPVLQMNFG